MKKTVSKLLKKTGRRGAIILLALSGLSSVAAWFLAQSSGLVERVPEVTVPAVEFAVAPAMVIAIPAGIAMLVVGMVALEALDEVGDFIFEPKERKKRKKQFGKLPGPAQALLVGLPFGIVVVVWFLLTNFLTAADLSHSLALVVGLAVWLGVSILTYWHMVAEGELARWLVHIVAGSLLTVILALGVAAADIFLLGRTLPGYVPLLIYLLGGPVVTAIVIRQARREEEGAVSALLVRTGFAQFQQLQTLTVALAVGFLAAVLVAVVVSFVGAGLTVTALTFLLVWLVVGLVSFQLFRRSSETRSDLVVADVYERSSGRRRELSVRNESDEVIDLRNAKIRDTDSDLYRTNIEVVLGAGQTGTFDLPPDFSLYPRSDDVAGDLPGGFSVSQHTDAPVVVTRNGQKFELQWGEGVSPQQGRNAGGRGVDSAASNDVNNRTGVGPRE